MKANEAERWFDFFDTIDNDPRLSVWHIALLTAIARLAYKQHEKRIIHVSRSKLMKLSHINSITSYHKYFKELQKLGYINYVPSYHPNYRSTVEIIKRFYL